MKKDRTKRILELSDVKRRALVMGVVVAGLGVLSLGAVSGCSKKSQASVSKSIPVEVEVVATRPLTRPLIFFGKAAAVADSRVAFQETGVVDSVAVKEGQLVKRGARLAALDRESLKLNLDLSRAQLSQAAVAYKKVRRGFRKEVVKQYHAGFKAAKASLEKAKNDYESAKKLWASKTISENRYVAAKAAYDAAKASLERSKEAYEQRLRGYDKADIKSAGVRTSQASTQVKLAKKRLDDSVLRAPFTGVVAKKGIDVGEIVGPRNLAFQLVDLSKVEIQIGVPEKVIGSVSVGQKVEVFVPAQRLKSEGKVVRKGVTLEKSTLTYPVTVLVENPVLRKDGEHPVYKFLPGNIAAVVFICPKRKRGISVPMISVLDRGRGKHVYVVRDGRAKKRPVKVGRIYRNRVVVEGLKDGELVVVTGQHQLTEGRAAFITEKKTFTDGAFGRGSPFLRDER